MYFAGLNGKNIISVVVKQLAILEFDLQSKFKRTVGFIKTGKNFNPSSAIGINVMNYNISGNNETESELFKFTNVSKVLNTFDHSAIKCFYSA